MLPLPRQPVQQPKSQSANAAHRSTNDYIESTMRKHKSSQIDNTTIYWYITNYILIWHAYAYFLIAWTYELSFYYRKILNDIDILDYWSSFQ